MQILLGTAAALRPNKCPRRLNDIPRNVVPVSMLTLYQTSTHFSDFSDPFVFDFNLGLQL